ncbi:uncharacterized protein LOC124934825 [Impatiens glandulifera]|uniref:uncharacterized protein LOC124934825 n=1 Tax=Impatiens glandulifera TaxID=253017 RepID=UPI001FB1236F|nr:uncharacterized protein LOC124934825 [Impatiens glandulifera]
MSLLNNIPILTEKDYDEWKIMMHAHLAAIDDDMWYVITDGPMKIQTVSTVTTSNDGAHEMKKKPRYEWTTEDIRIANLDNVAKDTLYKTLNKDMFNKIKSCSTTKEIWGDLT